MLLALSLCLGARVAVLENHASDAWTGACSSAVAQRACNLRLYDAAIGAAASLRADLALFPEAYGLSRIDGEYEPLISFVGGTPCLSSSAAASPQQHSVACSAQKHNVSVAAIFFVSLTNGTRRIMTVVYDARGAVAATYSKSHLVPIFEREAQAGPFAPTVVELAGVRWGLLICYEGVYPTLTGDWAQLDGLKASGAQALLWAIGGMVPDRFAARGLALRERVAIIASETQHDAALVSANGSALARAGSVRLDLPNYTAHASVVVADFSPAARADRDRAVPGSSASMSLRKL
jgi:predicted amidohydrolase